MLERKEIFLEASPVLIPPGGTRDTERIDPGGPVDERLLTKTTNPSVFSSTTESPWIECPLDYYEYVIDATANMPVQIIGDADMHQILGGDPVFFQHVNATTAGGDFTINNFTFNSNTLISPVLAHVVNISTSRELTNDSSPLDGWTWTASFVLEIVADGQVVHSQGFSAIATASVLSPSPSRIVDSMNNFTPSVSISAIRVDVTKSCPTVIDGLELVEGIIDAGAAEDPQHVKVSTSMDTSGSPVMI